MAVDPFSAAISIIGIGGSVLGALNAREQGKAQNQQAKMVAEDQRIQGLQKDTARLEDYYSTIASVDVIRASRNLSMDSQTGQAIDRSLASELRRNRKNEMGSYLRARSQTLMGGKIAMQAANARAIGYASEGVSSMFSLAQKAWA